MTLSCKERVGWFEEVMGKLDVAAEELGIAFTTFVRHAEPALRQALVASYGLDLGQECTAEALAFGWKEWTRVSQMANPVGYLFRVGQSSARQLARRPPLLPAERSLSPEAEPSTDTRALLPTVGLTIPQGPVGDVIAMSQNRRAGTLRPRSAESAAGLLSRYPTGEPGSLDHARKPLHHAVQVRISIALNTTHPPPKIAAKLSGTTEAPLSVLRSLRPGRVAST
jgi:hypothetical protein